MPLYSFAEPVVGGMPLPPASFTHVEDIELLNKLGMGYSHGGAWCYDSDANAILITAASREKAQCELRLQYELERQRVKLQFEIDKLNIRIDTLVKQHEEINLIKDQEINKLTDAALKRPNDYSVMHSTCNSDSKDNKFQIMRHSKNDDNKFQICDPPSHGTW